MSRPIFDPFAPPDPSTPRPFETGTTRPAAPAFDPFAPVEPDPLQTARRMTAGQDPDRAARVLKMQQRTGAPVEFIERNLDDIEKEATVRDFDAVRFRRESPALANWLLQNPKHLELAGDDLDQLTAIDRLLDVLRSVPGGVSQGVGLSVSGAAALLDIHRRRLLPFLPGAQYGALGLAKLGTRGLAELGGAISENAAFYMPPPERQNLTTDIAAGVGQLVPQVVTALATGGASSAASLMSMAMQGAGIMAERAEEAGKTGTAAGDITTLFGAAATGLTERYGLGKLLERVPPAIKNRATRWIADVAAAGGIEASQEVAEAILHNAATQLALDPNQDILAGLTREAMAAGGVGAVARAVLSAVVPGRARQFERADIAKANAEVLEALPVAIADSKTFQRLPEKVQEYIRSAVAGSSADMVYVQPEAAATYFQSKGLDPEAAITALTGDARAFQQAQDTGGRLAVPIENYTRAAAESGDAFLWRDAAIGDADAMSFNQAVEFEQALDAEPVGRPPSTEMTMQASAAKVREDIIGQLVGQGYSAEAIESHAKLFEVVFRTVGERFGVDPFELYQRRGLTIVREVPEILKTVTKLDQTDALIDRLRSGQTPTPGEMFGESMTDFLRARGGVQDEGGELAALDIDTDRKPFERKLIQPEGLPLDRAREMAAEAGYIARGGTVAEFLDAIEGEVRGQPVYAQGRENAQAVELATVLDELRQYLQAIDVDVRKLSNDQIKKRLIAAAESPADAREFAQDYGEGKRGLIQFGIDPKTGKPAAKITIALQGNLSTLLHESGHLWVELLNDIADDLAKMDPATLSATQQRILADRKVLLDSFGVGSRSEIQDEHHERFAHGFEAFLLEGQAPSAEVRGIFSRFREWLVSAYRLWRAPAGATREAAAQALQVQISDDIRGVMDRLIASDEAIAQAREDAGVEAMLESQQIREKLGLNSEQFKPYDKLVEQARDAAKAKLDAQLAKDAARAHETWWKERRAEMRQQVAQEVYRDKGYYALAVLQTGKHPDGTELPEGSFVGKLDAGAIEQRYGKYKDSSIMQQLRKLGVYRRRGGVHPDVAAEMLGFKSGEALLEAIATAGARPMEEFIDAETDSRMRQVHGDLLLSGEITEKAREAVLGPERSEILQEEARILKQKQKEVAPFVKAELRSERKQASRGRRQMLESLPPVSVVRAWAVRTIGKTPVGELRPGVHWNAAKKASTVSFKAASEQDWSTAYTEKLRELRNAELYRAATAARQHVEDLISGFAPMFAADSKLTKFHDMDFVNAARAIAATILDYPTYKQDALTYLNRVKDYDPELYASVADTIESALGSGKTYPEMTVEEFKAAADVINGLFQLSRSNRQIEIDGKLLERDSIIQALHIRMSQVATSDRWKLGYEKAVTRWERTQIGLMGLRSALRRVESWVDAIDGGDPNGVFRRFIWNPISEAAARYRVAKIPVLERYLDLVKTVESSLNTGRIEAGELGYTFSNKGELLHAVLHTGNASNRNKLLLGRGWGEIQNDGDVDTVRWDTFFDRMQRDGVITKADMDFVQGVWDLLESLKPAAQRTHRKLYGGYFKEITAEPVQTRFGEYRGGYVPAIVDPFVDVGAAAKSERQAQAEADMSFAFPSTGRGFSRTRIEQYTRPLALNLGLLPQHIDKVLRFTHIQPAVKDVGRIVFNRDFQQILGNVDPTVAGDLLIPWLQRAATQRIAQPSKGRAGQAVDTFFREVRKRTGLQMLSFNLTNAAQQLTGLSVALLKVKPRFVLAALWTYVRAPQQTARAINEKSDFMKTAMTGQVLEIQQTIDDLLTSSKYDKARAFAQRHGYFFSQATQNVVNLITWQGAYDGAVENGADELSAVRQADAAVRASQGSFAPEDISRAESGSPFVRTFLQFYSYFNQIGNTLGTEFTIVTRDMGLRAGAGRALYLYSFGFLVPAVVSELIIRAMSGRGLDADDDDDYLDDAMSIFFGSQLRTAAAMVPGAGPALLAGVNAWNEKWYDDRISTSPAVSAIESAVRAPHSVYKAITDPDRSKKRAIQDTLTLIGMLSGYPTAPVGRPLGYLADIEAGEAEPENALEFARGVVSGRSPER